MECIRFEQGVETILVEVKKFHIFKTWAQKLTETLSAGTDRMKIL